MSAKHTPGEWHYDPDQRLVYADRDGDTESPTIADVLDTTEGLEGDCPQADANGRLIAEAPELYEALAECEVMMDSAALHGVGEILAPAYREMWVAAHERARAALAKVRAGS